LFITYQITKPSLIFSKSVMVGELLDTQVALQNVQKCFTVALRNLEVRCEIFEHCEKSANGWQPNQQDVI